MADLASAFKRVPKWAWIAGAGVVGGGLYVQSRGKAAKEVADTSGGVSGPLEATPASGVVVPPIVVPSAEADNQGLNELQAMYFEGNRSVLENVMGWTSEFVSNVGGSLSPANAAVWSSIFTDPYAAVLQQASNVNSVGATPPAGVVTVAAPGPVPVPSSTGTPAVSTPTAINPPAPKPCSGGRIRGSRGCYSVRIENKTKRNGNNVWCVVQTIHDYEDGSSVVVREDKVKNGSC